MFARRPYQARLMTKSVVEQPTHAVRELERCAASNHESGRDDMALAAQVSYARKRHPAWYACVCPWPEGSADGRLAGNPGLRVARVQAGRFEREPRALALSSGRPVAEQTLCSSEHASEF